jgi:molybdopterin-guanine dinucleotide biosynthesis protein A
VQTTEERQSLTSMNRKNHGANGTGSLPDLPVFQVLGGSEAQHDDFVRQLLTAVERRHLYGISIGQPQDRNRQAVLSLARLYDLVIIDSRADFPAHQIRLGKVRRHEAEGQALVWSGGGDRNLEAFIDRLIEVMDRLVRRTPVWGCILIGGKSSRMGRPKHLIEDDHGSTWLERTAATLRPLLDGLVVSGAGTLPVPLHDMVRLADIPGGAGPLAGVLAASRWQPLATWLFVACDMPRITPEAVRWLLAGRRAGSWGRVPRLAGSDRCEPLFAWYDFRAGQLFEQQHHDGNLRISEVAGHPKIDKPLIPGPLRSGWQNINTPEELEEIQ